VNTVEQDIPNGVSSRLLDSTGSPYVPATPVAIATLMTLQGVLVKGSKYALLLTFVIEVSFPRNILSF